MEPNAFVLFFKELPNISFGPLGSFAIIGSFFLGMFVYYCNDCGKPETGEYKQWCRICHHSDLCEERWETENQVTDV